MGQDQSTQQGGGGGQQHQNHKDPHNNNHSSNNPSPRPSRPDLSSSTSTSNTNNNNNNINSTSTSTSAALYQNDDEVLAILKQLETTSLPQPLLKCTALPPDQEVQTLRNAVGTSSSSSSSAAVSRNSSPQSTAASFHKQQDNNSNNSKHQLQQDNTSSSPTLESISNFISEMKRKAQSASNQLSAPTFRERNAEVKTIQQQQQPVNNNNREKSTSSSTTTTTNNKNENGFASLESSRAGSPSASTTTAPILNASTSSTSSEKIINIISSPLPTLPAAPLLQSLGRPQTLNLREISSNCVPRCERIQQETAKLNLELQGLKSAALQQIRLGQKCYSVETEVKRLHLELGGDDKGSAAARSIGHDESFPSLMSVCEETSELLDKVHNLLGDEPRKLLQEYAQKIEARSPKSPILSPVRKKKF